MRISSCLNGHFYDADKYEECPFCGQASKTESELDEDTDITVSTDNGINSVHVSDGMISVISADCPDQICVDHAHIMYEGETIVCLPHRLIITIISKEGSETDAISQ